MNKYDILKKIGIIINELQDQYDYTEQHKDDINDLELELFVANGHFLTDHIEILRKLNDQQKTLKPRPIIPDYDLEQISEPKPQEPEPEPEPEERYFEPVIYSPPVDKDPFEHFTEVPLADYIAPQEPKEPVAEEVVPEEPEPIIRHELILDKPVVVEEQETDEKLWDEDELPVGVQEEDIEPEPEPVTETPEESEPVNAPEVISEPETISEPEIIIPEESEVIKTQIIINETDDDKPLVTINQMISAQLSPTPRFGDSMELQPIKDLKSAITLNDKLLFVRDLFNGYSMAYGEAIEILNRFSKLEEADQFLKINYYTKNNWEAKQATTDRFYSLLQRRFGS